VTQLTFGPYSPTRSAGNLMFISGQVGVDSQSKIVPEDIAGQTEVALKNLEHILTHKGIRLDNIIKTTIFLVNMSDFDVVNAIYERYFDAPRPARSTVGVRELPRVAGNIPLLIEIEAIAYEAK
jgi:2-iminobutanoate/2-iminopropanoate deaminase